MVDVLLEGFTAGEIGTTEFGWLKTVEIEPLLAALADELGVSLDAVEMAAAPAVDRKSRCLKVTISGIPEADGSQARVLADMALMCLLRYVREQQVPYRSARSRVVGLPGGRAVCAVWRNPEGISPGQSAAATRLIERCYQEATRRTSAELRTTKRPAYNFVWLPVLAILIECRQALLHRRPLQPTVRIDKGMLSEEGLLELEVV